MPIHISHHEQAVYVAEWFDAVSMSEIITVNNQLNDLVRLRGHELYALVIDLTQCTQIPIDFAEIRKLVESTPSNVGYVVVNAPIIARALGEIVHKLTQRDFYFTSSRQSGIMLASKLLEVHQVGAY